MRRVYGRALADGFRAQRRAGGVPQGRARLRRAEIAPHAEAWDRDHTFPVDTVPAMGELGLFGLPFPEEYGGAAPTSPRCASPSRRSAGSTSRWRSPSRPASASAPTRSSASAPKSSGSGGCPTCARAGARRRSASTEPDAGSDAGGTRTRAALDDATTSGCIDGEKAFITNSGTPITSLVTVTAHAPGRGPRSARSSSPPARRASRSSRRTARWAGTRPTPTASRFDECRVPGTNLLGERARGFAQLPRRSSTTAAIAIAALAVGVVAGCLEQSRRVRQGAQRVRQADRREPGASRSSAPTSR